MPLFAQRQRYGIALLVGVVCGVFTLQHNFRLIGQGAFMAQDYVLWRDVAAAIYEGQLPYSTPATSDIKPPVLYLIIILLYGVGWQLSYGISAAIAFGVVCAALYLIAAHETNHRIGIAPPLLFLYAIHYLHLLENGVRPWALVFMLGGVYAVQVNRPKTAGILIALAGLTWQYVGLALFPLLLLANPADRRTILTYTVGVGVAILALFNLIVPELRGAVFWSVAVPMVYVLPIDVPGISHATAAPRAFAENPRVWASYLWGAGFGVLPVLGAGLIGTWYARRSAYLVGFVLGGLPMFAVAHTTYYMLILPWACLGFGILLAKATTSVSNDVLQPVREAN